MSKGGFLGVLRLALARRGRRREGAAKISDFLPANEFHRLDLSREFYGRVSAEELAGQREEIDDLQTALREMGHGVIALDASGLTRAVEWGNARRRSRTTYAANVSPGRVAHHSSIFSVRPSFSM